MSEEESTGRLRLLWDALVFQAKLAVDGTRDLILIPISIVATLVGLLFGGHEPDRYFKRVLEWGRKSEVWINLFGHRTGEETSDTLIEPLQKRVFDEVERNPALKKASVNLNRALDQVASQSGLTPPSSAPSEQPADPTTDPLDKREP